MLLQAAVFAQKPAERIGADDAFRLGLRGSGRPQCLQLLALRSVAHPSIRPLSASDGGGGVRAVDSGLQPHPAHLRLLQRPPHHRQTLPCQPLPGRQPPCHLTHTGAPLQLQTVHLQDGDRCRGHAVHGAGGGHYVWYSLGLCLDSGHRCVHVFHRCLQEKGHQVVGRIVPCIMLGCTCRSRGGVWICRLPRI